MIVPGDILVIDNASVHVAAENQELLDLVIQKGRFRIVTLPTYSPELNPCELVFGFVKNFLRSDDGLDISHLPLPTRIGLALGKIGPSLMYSWYLKCMAPRII